MVNLMVAFLGGVWEVKRRACRHQRPWMRRLYSQLFRRWMAQRGSWWGLHSQLADEPNLLHGGHGVFVSQGARIGRDCQIFQHVTIGSNTLPDSPGQGAPTIGDRVMIGAGAKIIGGVRVGNNVRIGAGAVVVKDVPSNSVVVGPRAQVISRENLDTRFVPYN